MKSKQEVIQAYTPAPWRWEFNERSKSIQICGGVPKYDLIVMDFVRYGMNGAQPRFNVSHENGMQIMENANTMGSVIKGREHHQSWFKSISHPDALLMVKAPEMLEMLKEANKVIEWYMENANPDNNHTDFFNIGMNQRTQIEELIKSATTI
ncbi:Uncharacterised protein [Sphingobacterium multivorum]|uniref:hypothetical protein n=1 Tax=Sphingobacterium multivorum TaxID=28454 RepID=UPI000E07B4B0|nr:hypothetical protein [Sphingobacterium multivorum]QQT43318.1 hypothetical protein I6J00_16360 [Sphingobacterium multivorum]QQT44929.1 hypothetical protein I6J00_25070 [Sphingobacterium multivorum]SUI98720.1 Uncharacterised protein [Sphingobacterium multivorum]SUJ18487.1 Uncharacterised protein [Sphingobacterium multivorum]